MCFSDEARVPVAPATGSVDSARDLELVAADGNHLGAHVARAGEGRGVGLVILPDVRGLHQYYRDLAGQFARAGVDAVAIDYFGRTAGIGGRGDDFEYMPHVQATTDEGIAADTAAAVALLRSEEGGSARSVFTVGFCFGGSASWSQAAAGHGLAGSMGFYGRPSRALGAVDRMANPLLVLIAGDDQATDAAAYVDFDERLTAAGVPHEMHTYDGAPHSFFDRSFADWKDACDDAWRRMLGFIDAHATAGAAAG